MSVFAVIERLAPIIESEVNLVINCKQEAASLSKKLIKIQVGLQEAERIGVTDKGVKDWLKELEAVTYEVDDVLDEFESANLQVEVQDTSLSLNSLLDSLTLCFNQVVSRGEITQKMKALSVRIDTILTNKGKYIFTSGENDPAPEFKQEESTSLENIKFYGLDLVKKSLINKLVSDGKGEGNDDDDDEEEDDDEDEEDDEYVEEEEDEDVEEEEEDDDKDDDEEDDEDVEEEEEDDDEEEEEKDTQIISIVGVGGVGKSTLAGFAYNDPQIHDLFDPKGWVSVSQPFNAFVVAKAILESFGEKSDGAHNLETVVQSIKKAVDKKRFLLVLDNVWEEDRTKWESLKNCLQGGKGSRIVVTTRHKSVAKMMGTSQWQSLPPLSDSDCGKILNGVALEGREKKERIRLRGIGMEIAKKCNGLPLAARSVGSMLALKSSEWEWRAALESPLWTNGEKMSDLFRALNLSFTDLSPVLKCCFLSTVVFPKGTELSFDEISKVWVAYGYLNPNGDVNEVKLKGLQYFNNLVNRSFFQRVTIEGGDDGDDYKHYLLPGTMPYKMHDTMHDFATHLLESDEYSFIVNGGLKKEKSCKRKSQRGLDYNSLGKFRTYCVCREELLANVVSHLTSVRVLSLRECNLQGLPEDIGKLIHLRYLNVSHNPISQLPETITGLCNLQTLNIERCESLSSLPEGIEKLINLRHLLNGGTSSLFEFPQGLEKLSGLQTLSQFMGSSKLGYLRNLNQLQGEIKLFFKAGEFGDPKLGEKQHIENLFLSFNQVEETDEMVEALKPPPNLLILDILGSSGKWLSRWITSFDKLKVVTFSGNADCTNLPPFCKLPALEELAIEGCGFKRLSIGFLGLEDASSGGFPRLKKLRFMLCLFWEEWEDIKEESVPVMTSLEVLEFHQCWDIEELPSKLLEKATSLEEIKLSGCPKLTASLNKKSRNRRKKVPLFPNQRWNLEVIDPPASEDDDDDVLSLTE